MSVLFLSLFQAGNRSGALNPPMPVWSILPIWFTQTHLKREPREAVMRIIPVSLPPVAMGFR
jgi:hypothetical protein